MLTCCTVKCYGDTFELICFEFNFFFFFFFLTNNGTAMAVLAAPLPAALLPVHLTDCVIYIFLLLIHASLLLILILQLST